jgi:hypothetical protein
MNIADCRLPIADWRIVELELEPPNPTRRGDGVKTRGKATKSVPQRGSVWLASSGSPSQY